MVSVSNHISLEEESAKTLVEYTLEEVVGYTVEVLQNMPKSVDLLTTESDVVNSTTLTNTLTTAKSYTDVKIADLINSAPETMDTLKEIADAIKEHQDFTDALDAAIANKADKTTLNEITAVLDETDESISNINNSLLNIDSSLEEINQSVNRLDDSLVNTLQDSKSYTDERITALMSGEETVKFADVAEKDSAGNIITETYALKSTLEDVADVLSEAENSIFNINTNLVEIGTSLDEINSSINNLDNSLVDTLDESKSYTDERVTALMSGEEIVKRADIATKDSLGNVISETYSTKTELNERVAALIDSAPETMDTLKEVADAIKEHQDVTDALNSAIGMKADKTWVEEKIGDVDLSGVMSITDYDSDKDGVVNQADKVTNTLTIRDGEQVYTYDGSQPVELQVVGKTATKTVFTGTKAELKALSQEEQEAIEIFFNTEEDYSVEEGYASIEELANIVNGTTLVKRAERDKNNNDIVETYATKEQLSAMDMMINDVVTTNLIGILDGSTPVGDAGKLGGQLPDYYANAQDLATLRAEVEESIQGEMYTKAQVDELVDTIDTKVDNIVDGITKAAKAVAADSVTKATQDASGNTITTYYAKAADLTTANSNITKITDGTTKVAKATSADTAAACTGNAATATKATQDGSGNTITSYYATLSTAQTISGAKTFSGATKITNTTASSSTSTGALIVSGGIGCAGNIYGAKVYGAVYNDYAERRKAQSEIKPGYVVTEIGDDYVMRCASDRNSTAMIVSDTYGFLIGEDEGRFYSIPVGLSGRVLAYVSEYSKPLTIGDAVCSAKDGKVRKMNKLEKLLYPECIIGVVGGIPDYKEWGSENIQVDGRIWINLK